MARMRRSSVTSNTANKVLRRVRVLHLPVVLRSLICMLSMHQHGWTEEEDCHIATVWLEHQDQARREKKNNAMSNSAIAGGVHQMLAKRGGLGSARTKKQLEEWYQRKKQLHKKLQKLMTLLALKAAAAAVILRTTTTTGRTHSNGEYYRNGG